MKDSYPDHYTAADIIADILWTDDGTPRGTVTEAAQALKDSGRLMPDLPEPTRWKQNEEPKWDACHTRVSPAGYEGRVIVEDFYGQWEASASDVRALAYAMLAAADYAERNQA